MLSENQLPDFTGSNIQDVRAWWDQIILLGLNTHPDEDPAKVVMIATGEPALTASACQKIQNIYQEMFELFGDKVYEVGTAAYMGYLGFSENQRASPKNGADYWVRSAL